MQYICAVKNVWFNNYYQLFMSTNSYNSAEREAVIQQHEDLLATLNGHVKYLKDVKNRLKTIESDLNEMLEYYYNDWNDDYEFFKSEKNYEVLNQDSVYEAIQEIYFKKMDILKFLVSKLK